MKINKSILRKKYWTEKLSTEVIAKQFNTYGAKIRRLMIKYKIPRRTGSEAHSGKLNSMFGKKRFHSSTTRKKMSDSLKGINTWSKGRHLTIKHKQKIGIASKKLWENIEYKNTLLSKLRKSYCHKQNKFEKAIASLLPKDYKYVGNGKFWIEGFNPDFVNTNGCKKIVEAYGDYWHNLPNYKERDIKRLKMYKKYGYDTLVIWQHELEDIVNLKNKIKDFVTL